MDSFIAIDYETANSHHESACALGISIVENGKVIDSAESLIKPPKEFSQFDPFNTMIHGIQKKDVKKSPDFKKVWSKVQNFSEKYDLPFACHYSGFDIRVTEALLKYYKLEFEEIKFYDTCTIARKMWPNFSNHKLNTLADALNIELEHHKASSDAEACAHIAIKQMKKLKVESLSEVAEEYGFKLGVLNADGVKTMSSFKNYGGGKYNADPDARSSKNVLPNQEVNYGSDLYDTEIVFTGELMSMNRKDAIQRAVNNGAVVGSGVTKRTNFLIVGISDFIDFDKGKITNKLKKAKDLSDKGQDISIIDEKDFLRMTI